MITVPGTARDQRSRTILFPVEGLLKKPVGGQLNPDGFYLYRTLASEYRPLLYTMETDRGQLKTWLDTNGVFNYDDIIMWGEYDTAELIDHATWDRGYVVHMIVVTDPSSALVAIERSTPVMLVSHPAYGLPEWLPGTLKSNKEWADLEDRVINDWAKRLQDDRLSDTLD